jgi:hypothetical protein
LLKVKVEHPNALRFILQDEIYLLDEDKNFSKPVPTDHAEVNPDPEIETKQVNFNYLGANKKSLLIIVNYPEHEYMHPDHLTALESVLNRKSHSRDDVAILNLVKYTEADHEQLSAYFKPKTLILLGKGSIPNGMQHPQFNTPVNLDGVSVLYTFSFDEMMTNNDNKKAFWEQMKAI